jgi:hypothetical protein
LFRLTTSLKRTALTNAETPMHAATLTLAEILMLVGTPTREAATKRANLYRSSFTPADTSIARLIQSR